MGREEVRFASGEGKCVGRLFRPETADGPGPLRRHGLRLLVRARPGPRHLRRGPRRGGVRCARLRLPALGREPGRAALADGRPPASARTGGRRSPTPALWTTSTPPESRCGATRWGPGNIQALAADGVRVAGVGLRRAPAQRQAQPPPHRWSRPHGQADGGGRPRHGCGGCAEPRPIAYRWPGSQVPSRSSTAPTPFPVSPRSPRRTRPGATRSALGSRLAPPYSLTRKVSRISCPTLYLVFEEDDVNPPELGRRAAERAPRGELRAIPGRPLRALRQGNLRAGCRRPGRVSPPPPRGSGLDPSRLSRRSSRPASRASPRRGRT